MLPDAAAERVDDLLLRLDRALPGRIEGFYVVGSACLGTFRHGRSDVDFVAIVDGPFREAELRRLRAVHIGRWVDALVRDGVLRRRWPLVCNGSYLERGALSRSPLEATALAGHVAGRFAAGAAGGFDVNPVTWHTLARHGIAVRGPEAARLEVHTDPIELRDWTRANLDGYWRDWVRRARGLGSGGVPATARRFAASGVLGVSRLHYTLVTGEITGKEAAGEYALQTFGPQWRPVVEDALGYWRGAGSLPGDDGRALRRGRGRALRRGRVAADFVAHVIDSASEVKDFAGGHG